MWPLPVTRRHMLDNTSTMMRMNICLVHYEERASEVCFVDTIEELMPLCRKYGANTALSRHDPVSSQAALVECRSHSLSAAGPFETPRAKQCAQHLHPVSANEPRLRTRQCHQTWNPISLRWCRSRKLPKPSTPYSKTPSQRR